MRVCVYLHLSGYISFIFNLIKRLHQKPTNVVVAKGQPNKLQLMACLHQAKKIILARTFKINDQNPGVAALELMICIFKLK